MLEATGVTQPPAEGGWGEADRGPEKTQSHSWQGGTCPPTVSGGFRKGSEEQDISVSDRLIKDYNLSSSEGQGIGLAISDLIFFQRSVCVYIPEVATPGTPLLTSLQRKRILPLAPEPCNECADVFGRKLSALCEASFSEETCHSAEHAVLLGLEPGRYETFEALLSAAFLKQF
ncbi:hypothetical protein E5288_WYG003185 [Bos mutus]|uniref:Uncharacterized protein n=1 Tax=Bos mutus TaxID=72004 RepID=A0A6B0REB9_9CETA|nr:hypothetical protein [Bos mutus]